MMKYRLTLGQAYVMIHNAKIGYKGQLDLKDSIKLIQLKNELTNAKRWSSRLWNNYKYMIMKLYK